MCVCERVSIGLVLQCCDACMYTGMDSYCRSHTHTLLQAGKCNNLLFNMAINHKKLK